MKKILCLIDTLGVGGGAERQMIGLVQLLRQHDYPTDIVIYHDNAALPFIKEHYGVEPYRLIVKNSQWSKLMAVRRYIKQKGPYDWVITYKGGPNSIGCLLKALGMKFKLIVSERIVNFSVGNRGKRFNLYRYANYVVPNAYSQGEFLSKEYPWMTEKIVPISNFTDTNLFVPVNKESDGCLHILTVARITEQKNVPRYLDAIALLKKRGVKNIHFDWVGKPQNIGDEQYAKEVFNKAEELGINDMITFHPQTYEIVKHYQACDIFCLPSNFEGYPNVVCEAMSCGKPIACSRVCDNPRIVNEGENGLLFNPADINDMADKLQEMINMSVEQRTQCGKRSRELAELRFSREAFVEKYISLIER